jgi:tRNA dimethylallyltransferase
MTKANNDQAPAVMVMGPTASGKTGLAVELVERFPMDIISVDSALVYRGMDIGTAKPDAATLVRAPHRLIDIREPWEPYSAADFRADALREMAEITGAGRTPLLVGGTMLYFRALLDGLAPMPSADLGVRRAIEARAKEQGWPALHSELAGKDPQSAARINPNDPQRIQRALEVMELTGRSLSDVHAMAKAEKLPYRVLKIVVCPAERATLHQRIEKRFDAMLEEGFAEEMSRLRADPRVLEELPAMRAVGYRQAWGWLEGRHDQDSMREKALAATRQLAKRQLTWLRREDACLWYDLADDKALGGLVSAVQEFLEA